jgi:hypothetical protein
MLTQQSWTDPTALEKKAPDIILSTLADWSTFPSPSFSRNTASEVVMKAKHLFSTGYNGLLGPYL